MNVCDNMRYWTGCLGELRDYILAFSYNYIVCLFVVDVQTLICDFHRKQAWMRWTSATRNNVSQHQDEVLWLLNVRMHFLPPRRRLRLFMCLLSCLSVCLLAALHKNMHDFMWKFHHQLFLSWPQGSLTLQLSRIDLNWHVHLTIAQPKTYTQIYCGWGTSSRVHICIWTIVY